MSNVRVSEQSGVTVVTLDDGKANTLGAAMVQGLTETAASLAGASGPVVLTGAGRFFSAGLDLGEVYAMDRATLGNFLDGFEKMALAWFALARPVVAAVNGHAIAGGAILALTADFRLAARSEWKIGLTEVSLGIPFPASALELTRFHVDPSHASRVFLGGELFAPEDARVAGLVDRVVEPDGLLASAAALAAQLGRSPGVAYARTKSSLREPTMTRYESVRSAHREVFLDGLCDPAVRAHIGATLEAMRTKKK